MSLPKPYYEDGSVTIYHGDCLELMPLIEADVLVTDPPYGVRWTGTSHHGRINPRTGKRVMGKTRAIGESVRNDNVPFDPGALLDLGLPTVMFGANHFSSRLPDSPSWIVWDKRVDGKFGPNQADCEMAWTNLGGPARMFRLVWNITSRKTDLGSEGKRGSLADSILHPTQKPVRLMRWVLARCPDGVVCDPFLGSGTTLRAAKDLGRKAIGIELEERYCQIAAERCSQEVLDLGAAA